MLRVKEFREERGLAAKDVVKVIREQYPGYDRYLNSKVENPERYGVRLVNEAEALLEEAYVKTAPEARKRDRRRLPCKIQCRLSKSKFERLQQALKRDGFDTMQAGLSAIITKYLEGNDVSDSD